MIRPTPQPGEKWRHFKGTEYTVLAIPIRVGGQMWVVYSKSGIIPWRIFSTEDDKVFGIHYSDNSYLPILIETYDRWKEPEINDSTIWARPLDNFMEVLSSDSSDRASNYYRFERVEAEVTSQ